ncbi:MAG: NAD(P)H-hydrate dehydratase [Thermomicrobium sp.]|nr:NAD(P)H-hydrate dehydratase [Thermomicrobium sp.]
MLKLCTVDEVRRAEAAAVAAGTSLTELMARAGRAVATAIERSVPSASRSSAERRALFLVGPGNNGGDGLVAAGLLAAQGWQVRVWAWNRSEPGEIPAEREHLARCRWLSPAELDSALAEAEVIVDAVFGIGSRPSLPEAVAAAFDAAYRARVERGATLVAVDVPSGIDSDTGAADERAFRADLTVMLGLPKVGAYRSPALRYTGLIELVDIGLPAPTVDSGAIVLPTDVEIRRWLPRRTADTHKWAVGALLIVGGAPGYYGAPRLAAAAALRAGAGLVTLAVPRSLVPTIAAALPEVTYVPAPDGDVGAGQRWAEFVRDALPRYRALLVGPGLGQDRPAEELMRTLFGLGPQRRAALGFAPISETREASDALARFTGYAVVDADGLNWLAKLGPWHEELREARLILTPHPGELARLLDVDIGDILRDPWQAAATAARTFGQHVVLKVGHTAVASPDGTVVVAPQVHPALATAGTGDVLAGLIAGFAAQGLEPLPASVVGVYVANRAALRAIARKGTLSLLASDIVEEVPAVLSACYEPRWVVAAHVAGIGE